MSHGCHTPVSLDALVAACSIRNRTLADGTKRYDVRYRRGGRFHPVEHGGTFTSMKAARIRQALIADMLAAGQNPRVELDRMLEPSRSFTDVSAEWLASRRSVATGTLDGYRHRQKTLETHLRGPVDQLTVRDVQALVVALEASYRAGTVRLFVTQLRMILDYHGGLNVARDRRVELPRVVRVEPDPPTHLEVAALLDKLRDPLIVPVLVMELAGTRVSETLSLQPDDIGEGTIRVRREAAKGQRRGRVIPVPEVLTDAIRLPFGASRHSVAGGMRHRSSISPHDLRHRRATLWYQQGIGPVELARRLGHGKPSMSLDVYAHVKPLEELPGHLLSTLLK